MDLRTYKIMSINVLWYKPKFQSVSQVFKAVELVRLKSRFLSVKGDSGNIRVTDETSRKFHDGNT